MYYLAIDQGTTGSTAMLVDSKTFKIISKKNKEFRQILPSPGIVEHSLDDIWNSVKDSVRDCISASKIDPKKIEAIGITNQRETICAFEQNGDAIGNAIVWQDRRTNDICQSLKKRDLENKIKSITGLTIDPYFSGTKISWLINNSKEVQECLKKSNCLFGNIDTYLLMKLTNSKSFYTEPSNASRTMLMDLSTSEWSKEMCDILEVPLESLPKIKSSFGEFGLTANLDFLPDGIPITGILGDQQSALFGQGGIEEGDLKCTYGTGAFALLNTSSKIKYSKNGLLTTVAYKHENKTSYAIEGSSYIAGAAVQWLRDNIGIIDSAPQIEELASKVTSEKEMENICFYPYFTGLGSPYWKSEALASIQGISRDTNTNHISRACLESIALTIDDLIIAMEKDSESKIKNLRVDGGAVTNNLLNQFQANFSKLTVQRPEVIETTAFGAILACALGLGRIKISDVKKFSKVEREYSPEPNNYYETKKLKWKKHQQNTYL